MSDLHAAEYIRFEDIKRTHQNGSEYWYARDLALVLDYTKWENFHKVVKCAMIACDNSKNPVSDHFPEVRKTSISHGGVKIISCPATPAISSLTYDYITCVCGCCNVDGESDYLKRSCLSSQDYYTDLSELHPNSVVKETLTTDVAAIAALMEKTAHEEFDNRGKQLPSPTYRTYHGADRRWSEVKWMKIAM